MTRQSNLLIFLLAISAPAFALYGSNSKVVKLTAANFREKVLNSNQLWFVEFYAPWCGHCKSLAPEWEKLAKGLDGIINVGAVDMTTDQAAGQQYGIQGFPTIKFFGNNKQKPADYNGGRDTNSMITFAFERAQQIARSKAFYNGNSESGQNNQGSNSGNNGNFNQNGGSCSGNQSGGNSNGGSCSGGQGSHSSGSNSGSTGGATGSGDGKVIVLTDSNFSSQVLNSDSVWMVEFYAPWCGHCKNLQPEWESAARRSKDVKWAKVDCTQNQSVCGQYGVQGYPTIKAFTPGARSSSDAIPYEGGRTSNDLSVFAEGLFAKNAPPKQVKQLKSHNDYKESCVDSNGACFIFLVPHLLDSSEQERKEYLEMFQQLSKEYRGKPVNLLWSQGGDQYEVEETLGLTAGYPAAVSILHSKGKYVALLQAFTKENIKSWIDKILFGGHPFYDLPKNLQEWKTISA